MQWQVSANVGKHGRRKCTFMMKMENGTLSLKLVFTQNVRPKYMQLTSKRIRTMVNYPLRGPLLCLITFEPGFKLYKEPRVTIRTKLTYMQVHNVLTQYVDNTSIESITRHDYQLFLQRYGRSHAKSTVSKNNSLIHACVKGAIYDSVIRKDFVANSSILFDPKRTKKIDYLSIHDMTILTNYLQKTLDYHFTGKYMILLAVYTGMRLGKIQGLKWSDINLNFKTISISGTWNDVEKEFKPTKNESSVRIIRVNASILTVLSHLHDSIHPKDEDEQVFINQYETISTSSAVNKTLKESLKILGIKRGGFHFHSLRHTHVAYLLANNIDLYVISKRLGHSDVGTTSRVYSYLIDEYKTKTDLEIENVLNKIGNNDSDDTKPPRTTVS